MSVQLEACAICAGRVVDEEKQPVRGLIVNVTYDQPDNWRRALIPATTDDDGRFEVLLPPGMTYRIWQYMQKGLDFSAECVAKPGAVFELGDLSNDTKLTVEQLRA